MRQAALPSGDHPIPDQRLPVLTDATRLEINTWWEPRSDHRYRGVSFTLKRIVDVIGTLGLAVLFAPVMLLTAVVIRLTSSGPVIYRQTRVGRRSALFTMYKFRTMHADAETRLQLDRDLYEQYRAGGFKISCEDDPRITSVGTFLRKSSIDELPQLLNVIKGDMSLVGPRPVVPDELTEYGIYVKAYLMAVPGLTGAWQVAGRDAVKFPSRARFDADYIDQWSLGRDLRILLMTVPAAASARGVE